jgi:hypothetical protein
MPGIDTAIGAAYPAVPYTSGVSGSPFFDWFLRNQVITAVIDGRNNKVPLLGMLYARKKPVAGKFIIQGVRDGRNYAGVSAIHPEGNMPDPGRQGAYNYSTGVRDIYARAKFSGKLLRMSQGDAAALADVIEFETQGLKDDLSIKQEIMLHGDGSGRRAQTVSRDATTITVKHNPDHEGISTVVTAPNIYLDVGMRVAFVSAAGTVRQTAGGQQAFYVIAKPATNTIQVSLTLGGALVDPTTIVGLVVDDWIVDASRDSSMTSTSGVPVDTGWRGEPMGLEGVMRDVGVLDGGGISVAGQQTGAQNFTVTSVTNVDSGFQGIQVNSGTPTGASAGTFPPPPSWNKAIVADGGGALRALSDGLIQRAISDARRINGADVKLLISAHQMYDSYIDQLYGDKRFNTNTLQGGHSGDGAEVGGVTWSGLSWHKSRFMLENKLFGLDPAMFSIYENQPLQVAAPPGNPMYERLHDKDAFWVAFVTSYNLFVELRDRAGFHLCDVQ